MINMLKDLYTIHSPTDNEWGMICFVRQWVAEHVPEAELKMDRLGNLYITKGEAGKGFPTLVCHLDQVQTLHSDDFEVRRDGDKLFGWSESSQQQEGLGADDKNGIYVCLRCLEECPRLKVFMGVGEEKGCIGSNRANMDFFSNSLYVLEPDCKGGKEPHCVLRGIPCASNDFIEALQLEANGYTLTEGKNSDILALTLNDIGVSCINLPVGYHNPHKDDEYTIVPELEHCLAFVKQIIDTHHRRFPHQYQSETQQRAEAYLKDCGLVNTRLYLNANSKAE
jgi:acetylornithine deacetylase/succinyl-diaminopimelate desuccinylase-like protein